MTDDTAPQRSVEPDRCMGFEMVLRIGDRDCDEVFDAVHDALCGVLGVGTDEEDCPVESQGSVTGTREEVFASQNHYYDKANALHARLAAVEALLEKSVKHGGMEIDLWVNAASLRAALRATSEPARLPMSCGCDPASDGCAKTPSGPSHLYGDGKPMQAAPDA